MTVVSLNLSLMTDWMKESVSMSTFEVASSRMRILLRRSSARERHSSCFWPTEKDSDALETLVSSCWGS